MTVQRGAVNTRELGAGHTTLPNCAQIRGRAVARGRWVGRARVITEGSLAALKQGEVAVCGVPPTLTTVLLRQAGALVLETGGELSTMATLARESGTPAVIARGASMLIGDGQLVSVDGDRGTVELLIDPADGLQGLALALAANANRG